MVAKWLVVMVLLLLLLVVWDHLGVLAVFEELVG
jgi:hypothetical protein